MPADETIGRILMQAITDIMPAMNVVST